MKETSEGFIKDHGIVEVEHNGINGQFQWNEEDEKYNGFVSVDSKPTFQSSTFDGAIYSFREAVEKLK